MRWFGQGSILRIFIAFVGGVFLRWDGLWSALYLGRVLKELLVRWWSVSYGFPYSGFLSCLRKIYVVVQHFALRTMLWRCICVNRVKLVRNNLKYRLNSVLITRWRLDWCKRVVIGFPYPLCFGSSRLFPSTLEALYCVICFHFKRRHCRDHALLKSRLKKPDLLRFEVWRVVLI